MARASSQPTVWTPPSIKISSFSPGYRYESSFLAVLFVVGPRAFCQTSNTVTLGFLQFQVHPVHLPPILYIYLKLNPSPTTSLQLLDSSILTPQRNHVSPHPPTRTGLAIPQFNSRDRSSNPRPRNHLQFPIRRRIFTGSVQRLLIICGRDVTGHRMIYFTYVASAAQDAFHGPLEFY